MFANSVGEVATNEGLKVELGELLRPGKDAPREIRRAADDFGHVTCQKTYCLLASLTDWHALSGRSESVRGLFDYGLDTIRQCAADAPPKLRAPICGCRLQAARPAFSLDCSASSGLAPS